MVHYAVASPHPSSAPYNLRPVELTCLGLCVAYTVYLIACFIQGSWLVDARGFVIPTDFVNVWAAGRLVLDGRPDAAYDWSIHKTVENAVIGYDFAGYYAWLYPPPFLFVAALLATLPLAAAQAIWSFLTFPAYIAAVRMIVGHRIGILIACAFPAVLSNFVVGQNGFLSAALLGGTLGFMEKRPILAGSFLGVLTYKPQFGILFPIVLVVSGRWRMFWAAAVVALLVNATSWIAFGTATWIAFFNSLPMASEAFLSQGQADYGKLQSIFGLVRFLGGSEILAWSAQGILVGGLVIAVCAIWRTHVAFELKAAALGVGALLSTPYLYMYDLVVLAVPVGFLFRSILSTGPIRGETAALVGAGLLLLVFPFVKLPTGPLAILIVAALIGARMLLALRSIGYRQGAPA